LEALPEHDCWARTPQLRYARPLLFEAGHYRVPGSSYTLRLTDDYGLELMNDD
jgi:hypothetical protein